jgi:hypothetical protein
MMIMMVVVVVVVLGILIKPSLSKDKTSSSHSSYEKSIIIIIERTTQYIKDRIENFDNYFPCRKKERKKCKLKNVLTGFIFML